MTRLKVTHPVGPVEIILRTFIKRQLKQGSLAVSWQECHACVCWKDPGLEGRSHGMCEKLMLCLELSPEELVMT
jgi:hypothetical protein